MDLNVGRCLGLNQQSCPIGCLEFSPVRIGPLQISQELQINSLYRLHLPVECVRVDTHPVRMS